MPFLTSEEWQVMELSVRVGVFSVLVSIPPAVLLGWLLARGRFRGKILLDGYSTSPWSCPPWLRDTRFFSFSVGGVTSEPSWSRPSESRSHSPGKGPSWPQRRSGFR